MLKKIILAACIVLSFFSSKGLAQLGEFGNLCDAHVYLSCYIPTQAPDSYNFYAPNPGKQGLYRYYEGYLGLSTYSLVQAGAATAANAGSVEWEVPFFSTVFGTASSHPVSATDSTLSAAFPNGIALGTGVDPSLGFTILVKFYNSGGSNTSTDQSDTSVTQVFASIMRPDGTEALTLGKRGVSFVVGRNVLDPRSTTSNIAYWDSPWEPRDVLPPAPIAGGVQGSQEFVYFTFQTDGKLRIDRFRFDSASGSYDWQEGISDDGLPYTPTYQSTFSTSDMKAVNSSLPDIHLGPLGSGSVMQGQQAWANGLQGISIFHTPLSINSMLAWQRFNFVLGSYNNLEADMHPCNTGLFMPTSVGVLTNAPAAGDPVVTPCGNTYSPPSGSYQIPPMATNTDPFSPRSANYYDPNLSQGSDTTPRRKPLQVEDPTGIANKSGQLYAASGTIPVHLRSVELDGWLAPLSVVGGERTLDTSSSPSTTDIPCTSGSTSFCLNDHYELERLEKTFGLTDGDALMTEWRANFISDTDFQNIKSSGFNTVVVPISWRNLQNEDGTWITDGEGNYDFSLLDDVVNEAQAHGLYVIFRLDDWRGQAQGYSNIGTTVPSGDLSNTGTNGSGTDLSYAAGLWSAIANHFAGEGTIAGFDLLNAPPSNMTSPSWQTLYSSVYLQDPNRMMFVQAQNYAALDSDATSGCLGCKNLIFEFQPAGVAGSTGQTAVTNLQNAEGNAGISQTGGSSGLPVFAGGMRTYPASVGNLIGALETQDFSWGIGTWKTIGSTNYAFTSISLAASSDLVNGLTPLVDTYRDTAANITAAWGTGIRSGLSVTNSALLSGVTNGANPPTGGYKFCASINQGCLYLRTTRDVQYVSNGVVLKTVTENDGVPCIPWAFGLTQAPLPGDACYVSIGISTSPLTYNFSLPVEVNQRLTFTDGASLFPFPTGVAGNCNTGSLVSSLTPPPGLPDQWLFQPNSDVPGSSSSNNAYWYGGVSSAFPNYQVKDCGVVNGVELPGVDSSTDSSATWAAIPNPADPATFVLYSQTTGLILTEGASTPLTYNGSDFDGALATLQPAQTESQTSSINASALFATSQVNGGPVTLGDLSASQKLSFGPKGTSYTVCSTEGGSCAFSDVEYVIFGAGGSFTAPVLVQGGTACTLTVFGMDPAYGQLKQCLIKPAGLPSAPPLTPVVGNSTAVYLLNPVNNPGVALGEPAGINQAQTDQLDPQTPGVDSIAVDEYRLVQSGNTNFVQIQNVHSGFVLGESNGAVVETGFSLTPPGTQLWQVVAVAGSPGAYSFLSANDRASLSLASTALATPVTVTFGSNGPVPLPSQQWQLGSPVTNGVPQAGYTLCANEQQECSFSDTESVIFGTPGAVTVPAVFQGGTACTNVVFGYDPVPGQAKQCWRSSVAGTSAAGPPSDILLKHLVLVPNNAAPLTLGEPGGGLDQLDAINPGVDTPVTDQYTLLPSAGAFVAIQNVASGAVVTSAGNNQLAEQPLLSPPSPQQLWQVAGTPTGYSFLSAKDAQALTVSSATVGTVATSAPVNPNVGFPSDGQQWKVQPVVDTIANPPSIDGATPGLPSGFVLHISPPTTGPSPSYLEINVVDHANQQVYGSVQLPVEQSGVYNVYLGGGNVVDVSVINETHNPKTNSPCPVLGQATSSCSIPSAVISVKSNVQAPAARIIVDASSSGTPISKYLTGANNVWPVVHQTNFDQFASDLVKNAGTTYFRFPGGFESEYYEWQDNKLDKNYSKYTATPGGDVPQSIRHFGVGNVSYVVKTREALNHADDAHYTSGASQAVKLVTKFGASIRDWQIGNEWYNFGGANQNYEEYLQRYATLLQYYVPQMKAAAGSNPIRIFVTVNVNSPDDMDRFPSLVGANVWNMIDGLDIHPYSGIEPSGSADVHKQRTTISQLAARIQLLRQKSAVLGSGPKLIYASEWAATLNDNDQYGGLANANLMVQVYGALAQAGVDLGAYWPPVNSGPQDNTVSLFKNLSATTTTFTATADAQLMNSISRNFVGRLLPNPVVVNSDGTVGGVTSIASQNGANLQMFIISGPSITQPQLEQISVKGFTFDTVDKAEVFYATGDSLFSGPAQSTDITSQVTLSGSASNPSASFTLNPGGSNRGTSWEIVRLSLSNSRAGATRQWTFKNGLYNLQNAASRLFLQAESGGPGSSVSQHFASNKANQLWQMTSPGGANNVLVNPSTGLALDDFGGWQGQQNPAGQWSINPSSNQQWSMVRDLNSGCYEVLAQTGLDNGVQMALEDPGWNTGPGLVDQYTFVSQANEEWCINAVLLDGVYEMTNKASGLNLENYNFATQNGAAVGQWPQTNGSNQKWLITSTGDGYVTIQNAYSGLVLDNQISSQDGTIVWQWTPINQSWQEWLPIREADGSYEFINKQSGLVLQMSNQGQGQGPDSPATEGQDNFQPWQKWSLQAYPDYFATNNQPLVDTSTTFGTSTTFAGAVISLIADGDLHSAWVSSDGPPFPNNIDELFTFPRTASSVTLYSSYGQGQGITNVDVQVLSGGSWKTQVSDYGLSWQSNSDTVESQTIPLPSSMPISGVRLIVRNANLSYGHLALNELTVQ